MYNRKLLWIKNKNSEIRVSSQIQKFVKEAILSKNLTKVSKIINRKNNTLHNTIKYDKKRMAYAIRFNYSNIKLL